MSGAPHRLPGLVGADRGVSGIPAGSDALRGVEGRAPQRQCRDHDDHGEHHYADPRLLAVWSCQGPGPGSRGASS